MSTSLKPLKTQSKTSCAEASDKGQSLTSVSSSFLPQLHLPSRYALVNLIIEKHIGTKSSRPVKRVEC
ncbi:hypothetical protein YC2023_026414 [Brassica napus]